MILQRRLNSIQRDLGPLEDKVGKLLSETRLLLDIVFTIFSRRRSQSWKMTLKFFALSTKGWVSRKQYFRVFHFCLPTINAFSFDFVFINDFLFISPLFYIWVILVFFCFHRNQKNQSSGIKSMSSAVPGSTLRTTWVEILKDKLVLVRGVALCCNGKDTTLYWFVKKEKHEAGKSKHEKNWNGSGWERFRRIATYNLKKKKTFYDAETMG